MSFDNGVEKYWTLFPPNDLLDTLLKFDHYVVEQLYFGIHMKFNHPAGEKQVLQFLS